MSPTPFIEHEMKVGEGESGYPVLLGRRLLDNLPSRLIDGPTVAVITNSTVAKFCAPRLINGLRTRGVEPHIVEVPDGEEFKTLDTVNWVYDRLLRAGVGRDTVVFALGGGVIGDIAGFVAATLLRGMPFVQLPTTLLAMVDASIGGKTAVDHRLGKNLIGAFNQPRAVIADLDTLATLPPAELRSGMAEVVKSAIIGDPGLFQELERPGAREGIDDWISRSIQIKVDIVTRDPFEMNERTKLNLGHTFAHAIERTSDFEVRHGEAVGIGLVCAARLAQLAGICKEQLVARIDGLVAEIGLPTRVPHSIAPRDLLNAMQTDKKRARGRLRFVLPRALGDVDIFDDLPEQLVLQAIQSR